MLSTIRHSLTVARLEAAKPVLTTRRWRGDTRDCSLLPWPGAGLDAAAKSPTDPPALSYNAGPATQAAGLNISNIQTAVPVFLLS